MARPPRLSILQKLAILVVVIIGIIGVGAQFYQFIEGGSHLDALYHTVMIMTGIGAEAPRTHVGKWFDILLALVSVGLLVSVLGQIFHYMSTKSLREMMFAWHDWRLRTMRGHTIICGTSYTLPELLKHLGHDEHTWIIVRTLEEARRLEAEGIHAHVDDFTGEVALRRAGLETAGCVVAMGENDAENAFVCLTAKHLRKGVPVVVRLSRSENREKLKAAGADVIVSPAELAAREMFGAIRQLQGSSAPS